MGWESRRRGLRGGRGGGQLSIRDSPKFAKKFTGTGKLSPRILNPQIFEYKRSKSSRVDIYIRGCWNVHPWLWVFLKKSEDPEWTADPECKFIRYNCVHISSGITE